MIQAVNPSGEPVNATVFSAIVAQEGTSDTIQFQIGSFPDDPDALRNGDFIDFSEFSTQELSGVAVNKLDNVLSARFDSGLNVEVREENGFLSSLLVAVPANCRGLLEGLMGNYNNDSSDDLLPRGASDHIPANSTMMDIHNQFGLSCELTIYFCYINDLFTNIILIFAYRDY